MRSIRLLFLFLALASFAGAPSRPNTYSSGATISSSAVTENETTIYTYLQNGVEIYADGTIVNADINSAAAIADTKLAQITTASKVSGAALTSLSSIPSGAGAIPPANLNVFVGSFTRDTTTATGTQAVTGTGFKPRAVIFFAIQTTTAEASWGFDAGGSNEEALIDQNVITTDTYSQSSTVSIYNYEGSNTSYSGDVSSFDTDGFTISWTREGTPSGTLTIHYMAI